MSALAFRNAMSRAVTGVTIVTTDGRSGRFGLTVSAVSSVSAEPPMLLVCINRRSVACEAIEDNGSFAVNVLAADQQAAAETFSGSDAHGKAYAFADSDWTTDVTRSPILRDAIAAFDCEIASVIPAATHNIFIGRVLATRERPATPLLYTGRSYGHPVPQDGRDPWRRFPSGTKNVLERSLA